MLALALLPLPLPAQTVRNVATEAQLRAAIAASAPGDVVNLTSDIVVTPEVVLDTELTIQGNGHRITVPVPAFDDAGLPNLDATRHEVFRILPEGDVHIDRLEIRGGDTLQTVAFSGGAVTVDEGRLRMTRSTISHSRTEGDGGGLANLGGEVYLSDSRVLRNAAGLFRGGGIFVWTGTLHLDRVTVAENRAVETVSARGGGVQIEQAERVVINNSTIANNAANGLGGGLWIQAPTFIANSTITGNIATGGLVRGAGVHIEWPTSIINSVVMNNFTYVPSVPEMLQFYDTWSFRTATYHMAFIGRWTTEFINEVDYFDRLFPPADPSEVFTIRSTPHRDIAGFDLPSLRVDQPLLVEVDGALMVTPRPGSALFRRDYPVLGVPTSTSGTATGYRAGPTPVFGYFRFGNPDTVPPEPDRWVGLVGSAAEAEAARVDIDQIGNPRPIGEDNFYVRGATSEVVGGYFQLRIARSAGGRFVGGSIFGDSHPVGASLVLTALPDDGQRFAGWACVEDCPAPLPPGTILSLANPYSLTMPAHHLTLSPVFEAADPGEFTVTYVGNRNTGGSVPASVRGSSAVAIAPRGDLVREGYRFEGWSTQPNGIAGTAYAPGQSHAGPGNLNLYAQWIHTTAIPVFSDDFEGGN